MPKNNYIAFNGMIKDHLERVQKNVEFIYTQTDSLITWLIGFSVTGLLLIVSNMAYIKANLRSAAKPVILLLALTIIAGITFRYISYLIMVFHNNTSFYFMGLYGDYDMAPMEFDEDVEAGSYDYIVMRIKDDFDAPVATYGPLNDDQKQREVPELIKYYKELCEYHKKEYDLALNLFADAQNDAYKIDRQGTIGQFSAASKKLKSSYHAKRWNNARGLLYVITLILFITTVCMVSIFLLQL